MRVGLIIYGRLSTISGGYLYDRKLVDFLRGQGDEVEIVSLPWLGYGRSLSHNLSPSLYRNLAAANFDLLLQDELNHPSLFWLNPWLKRQAAYPIVSIVHHLRCSEQRPVWQNWVYRAVEQRYLDSVDGFVFNSRTTQRVVEGLAGKRPFTIATPAGDQFNPQISAETIVARAHQPGPLRLLFVGNLIPRKGLHTLLAALSRLPRESWRLDVVGNTAVSSAYTQSVHKQINAIAPQQIAMHGVLPDEQLASLLANSHLLAVPSSYEGFGIVYLEGMGFGLPALAGRDGAAHEIITDGVVGFLVGEGETAVLAQQILSLHQSRKELVKMSLAARQRYLAQPTWAESMAKVRQFLQRDWGLERNGD